MVLRMQLLEMFAGDVGVYLGRRNIDMAKHDLHGPQIGAPVQEVGREGVAELVGGDRLGDPDPRRVALEELPEALAGHLLPARGQKDLGDARRQDYRLALSCDSRPRCL